MFFTDIESMYLYYTIAHIHGYRYIQKMEEIDIRLSDLEEPTPKPKPKPKHKSQQSSVTVQTKANPVQKTAYNSYDDTNDTDDADATEFLGKWLKTQNKRVTELKLPRMRGIVDLSVLNDHGFGHIKALFFSPGELTAIDNIPQGIEVLHISHNKLSHIDALPDTLEIIQANHNQLTFIAIGDCDRLVSLDVAYNQLSELEDSAGILPESLQILHCEYNRLKKLDFSSTRKLRELYCSQNPDLQLSNVPETVIYGDYRHMISKDTQSESSNYKGERVDFDYVVNDEEYNERVRTFFSYKHDYEQRLRKSQRKANESLLNGMYIKNKNPKIILHDRLGKRLRRIRENPTCRGCGGKKGMTFEISDNKYTAYCANEPACDWKIIIHRGFYANRENMIYEYLEYLEDLKQLFIEGKMDSLFRYLQDSMAKANFDKRMKLYELYSSHLKTFLATHDHLFYNEQTTTLILQKQTEIQEKIEQIKTILNSHTGEYAHPTEEIVRIQHEEIRPLSEFIQREKHVNIFTEEDTANQVFRLHKCERIPITLDTLLEGKPYIEHFGTTTNISTTNNKKTKKNPIQPPVENDEIDPNFYKDGDDDDDDDDDDIHEENISASNSLDWGSDDEDDDAAYQQI